jgi:hypothetical protein
VNTFTIRVVQSGNCRYVEGINGAAPLQTESDVLNLIGICVENDADRILLYENHLPESFFDMKTGHAGMILQKFVNYHLKVAAIISPTRIRGRFEEFVTETNRRSHFRVFHDRELAECWLLKD